MDTIFSNGWIPAIIGVIVGCAINHIFWLIQYKRQSKQHIRTERLKKIDDISDFCSALIEKSKEVYGLTITGQALQYFSETKNFWAPVQFYKTCMIVKFYFPKCIESFDELQLASSELVKLMQLNMAREQVTRNELDLAFYNIEEGTKTFQNCLTTIYSEELCL
jgi:hypothetical protein